MQRILLTLAFIFALVIPVKAQLSSCTVSGTAYGLNGAVQAGLTIRVVKVEQAGSLIATGALDTTTASDGTWSLVVPKSSTATFCSPTNGLVGMTSNCANGTRKTIPNASTATYSALVTVIQAPTQGLVVKDEGTALADPIGTLNFIGSGVTVTESSTGVAAITFSGGTGTGTVTSVAQSFTGGIISVAGSPITSSGTLALTVAGTSGGVPYFSSSTGWASSGALAANAIVIGGGAGSAPATTTTGTGVLTALGVNTGSAGALVVNGGALGTPSSGTLTNATGLPISTGVSGLGASVATFLATPSSANLASAITDETGSGALVFGTAPTIAGGTHTALTGLGIRSTGAAFDLTLASSEVFTAGRTLSFVLGDAARTISLGGNFTTSGTTTLSGTSSGTNTGDQTITLTGDVTGSGTGSFAATIGASKVTNAMLAGSITAAKLVGTDIATLGTITSGTWQGTAIDVTRGGIGISLAGIAKGGMISGSGSGTFAITTVGTDGQVWTADTASTGGAKWAAAGGGSGITIGTTTITSGTTTKVLFNNAGVVGEYTVTGTGNAVLSASPTLTGTVAMAAQSNSGVITQTSASATAFESGPNGGTNPVFRLVNSTASAATGLSITGNAAGSGVTLTALSSGADEPITLIPKGLQAVQLSGTSSSFPALLRNNANGFGNRMIFTLADLSDFAYIATKGFEVFNSSTPSAMDPSARGATFGSAGTNIGLGSSWTIDWASTSAGTGSFDTGFARSAAGIVRVTNGSTGAGGLLIGSSSATGTAGALIVAGSLANALSVGANGDTNPAFRVVTNTASSATGLSVTSAAAGSGVTLTALSSGSNEDININPKGTGKVVVPQNSTTGLPSLTFNGNTSVGFSAPYSGQLWVNQTNSGGIASARYYSGWNISYDHSFSWLSGNDFSSGSTDLTLRRAAAAKLAFGAADAASPVAQTLSVQNVVGGTTNTAGADWTFSGSQSTGTGKGGALVYKIAPAGSTGTAQNSLVTAMTIDGSGAILFPSTVTGGGTTGAQTINKVSGTVNFAAAATTLVVTNSLVTTSSLVFCEVRTNDTTATIKNVVPASGSFTITLTAAATAETSVGFVVFNQ